MSEVVWIEAGPRHAASAAPVSVLLAGGGSDRAYRHPVDGRQFRAGVTRRPLFSARLGFDETGWTGSTRPQTSVVSFSTADPLLRDALAALVWKDAPVSIDVGPEGAVPTRILVGKIEDVEFTLAGLTMTIVELAERLERPLATARFAGTGGIEGPAEAKGRIKRRSFGYVFNVEGRLLNAAHSIYEFGDPAHPLTGWSALRDKGREGTFAELAWQGSVAATLTALIASSPARGGGVVAPSIACAKWWTQPSGPLTADMIGTPGTVGGMQPAAIADAIAREVDGPVVADLPAAIALRDAIAGIHVGSDVESFAQAIDRVMLGASLVWLPRPDGTIHVGPWAFNGTSPLLQGEFRGRTRTFPPHGTRRIGFQRNERQHGDGEIAGVLLEELLDGATPLAPEDLLNAHQEWSDVQDATGSRPEDNATLGAQVGENTFAADGETVLGEGILRNDALRVVSDAGGTGGRVRQLLYRDGGATFIDGAQFHDNVQNFNIEVSGLNLLGIGAGAGTAVANAGLSIGANGVLLGGAGGQVTLSGIDTPGVIGRTTRLSPATGRVTDPQAYNTQLLLGPRSTTVLTPAYTVNATDVTVSLPSHTRKIAGPSGPVTLSYGSASGNVAFSTYWVAYVDDPDLTGMASPAVTFTGNPDDLLFPGRYQIASGVSPSSAGTGGGAGSGGGGGGVWDGCVAWYSWVEVRDPLALRPERAFVMADGRYWVRADRIVAGDHVRVLTDDCASTAWREVTGNRNEPQPGVRIVSASGHAIDLSTSTPITLRDGSTVLAPEAGAHLIPVDLSGELAWEACAVEPIGELLVAHISCRDGTYLAANEPGRGIYSHNTYAKP